MLENIHTSIWFCKKDIKGIDPYFVHCCVIERFLFEGDIPRLNCKIFSIN